MNFCKQVPGFPLPLEEKASLESFLSLCLQRDFALTFQSRSRLTTCKLAPQRLIFKPLRYHTCNMGNCHLVDVLSRTQVKLDSCSDQTHGNDSRVAFSKIKLVMF